MIFYNQNFKKERLIWMKFFRCKISRSSSWRHWKYKIWKWRKSEEHSCSSNQASAIQAKKRPVLAGFLPFSVHFFAFSSSLCIYKTNFAKKIRSGLHFLVAVEAQTFCLNSGRVANAFSKDKYLRSKKCVSLTAGEGINLWVMPLSQLFKNHSFETLDCRSNCQPNPECYCQKQTN